ncbi:unnamed protein product [Angiostrongylus costaricensis]|uniref:CDT1 domain-containing protein n=1 Tax=Angiostrongylus costaricensis TaxID=334426 RepID=A0A0R3Q1T3_ANGCS|nr:unnamed protein product [Angiostrongylus costaricensis]
MWKPSSAKTIPSGGTTQLDKESRFACDQRDIDYISTVIFQKTLFQRLQVIGPTKTTFLCRVVEKRLIQQSLVDGMERMPRKLWMTVVIQEDPVLSSSGLIYFDFASFNLKNVRHPISKSRELARATANLLAPGCAASSKNVMPHPFSLQQFGLRKMRNFGETLRKKHILLRMLRAPACERLARALQEFEGSRRLLAEAIWMKERLGRRAKSVDALKR